MNYELIEKALYAISKAMTGDEYKLTVEEYDTIHDVLTSLLQAQRQEICEGVEGLLKPICRCLCEKNVKAMEHNKIVTSALAIIKGK